MTRSTLLLLLVVIAVGPSTASTRDQCNAWASDLTDVSGSTQMMPDDSTWWANSTWAAAQASCTNQVDVTWSYFTFWTTTAPTCDDSCMEVYNHVKTLAIAAGRLDCWQSRYYGNAEKIACLEDAAGSNCGGVEGVFNKLQGVLDVWSSDFDAASAWGDAQVYNPPFTSNVTLPSRLDGVCGSSCLRNSLQLLMELDSDVPNTDDTLAQQGLWNYFSAFEGYVCHQDSTSTYTLPAGIEAFANVMAAGMAGSVASLNTFCDTSNGVSNGKLSLAMMLSTYKYYTGMPAGELDTMIDRWNRMMDFQCMKHDTTYCGKALGGADTRCDNDDPAAIRAGTATMSAGCRTLITTVVPTSGCCVKAYSQLNDVLNSDEPSSVGTIAEMVNLAGITYNDLPSACNSAAYLKEVSVTITGMSESEANTFLTKVKEDIAAKAGASKREVSGARVEQDKSGDSTTVTVQVGAVSQDAADAIDVSGEQTMINTQMGMARNGGQLGTVTATTGATTLAPATPTPTPGSGAPHASSAVVLTIAAISAWAAHI